MNKFSKYVLLPALCFFTSLASAANIKDYPTIAVMNFGNKAITSRGLRDHDFNSAAEYAIVQLNASGWFNTMDFEELNTMAKMHAINMSGLIDPGTAVAMGKIAAANFIVVGNVTSLTTKENVFGYQHANKGSIGNAQHVVNATVTMRIVDIETGRIVAAGLGNGSSSSTMTEIHFKKYRRNKIETETVSETITKDLIDEYTKNKSTTKSKSKTTDTTDKETIDRTNGKTITSVQSREDSSSNSTTNSRDNTLNRTVGTSTETNAANSNSSSNTTATVIENSNGGSGDHKEGYTKEHTEVHDKDGNDSKVTTNNNNVVNTSYYDENEEQPKEIPFQKVSTDDYKVVDTVGHTNKDDIKDVNNDYKDDTTKTNFNHSDTTTNNNTHQSNSSSDSKTIQSDSTSQSSTDRVENTSADKSTSVNTVSGVETDTTNSRSEKGTTQHATEEESSTEVEGIRKGNNENSVKSSTKNISYENEVLDYAVRIGTVEVSDVQVSNAIRKAIRDAVYGKMGVMTILNNGKPLKIKTGF